MTKERRNPDTIHRPLGPYAHQVEVRGETRRLVISGQVGMRPDGSLAETARDQLAVALANVVANLDAAGMTSDDLVKLTIFLTEEVAAEDRVEVLADALGGAQPAMTLVYVARLAAPPLKAEVEAIASAG